MAGERLRNCQWETENLRSTEPPKNLTVADSVREEWTDSLNPIKYVDKSIANYN